MKGRGWIGVVGIVAAVCLTPGLVRAQAFRYQPQSGTGAAQANAFSAQADDASALYYNPAGMTQLSGVQWSSTMQFVGASVGFHNAAGQRASGDGGGTIALPPPSQIYLTANLGDVLSSSLKGLVVGIGLNTPYALKSRYSDSNPFNTAVTSAAIPMMTIKPTMAYAITDRLSVGLGADIYTFSSFVGDGHVEQRVIWPGGGGVPAGASVEFNGKGTGVGMNASLLYHALMNSEGQPIANIGLIYRSQAVVPLRGQMLVNGAPVASTDTTLVLPPMYTMAFAVWPIRDPRREWKLEMDVDYVGWKTVRNTDIGLSSGGVIRQPQNWKTVPTVSVGTEYKWRRPEMLPNWDIAWRGGYTYTQSQVPDATFNPSTPSLFSHTVATGLGVTCLDGGVFMGVVPCGHTSTGGWAPASIGLDVSFQAWLYEPRTISGNNNPTVNGTYTAQLYLGALSLRIGF